MTLLLNEEKKIKKFPYRKFNRILIHSKKMRNPSIINLKILLLDGREICDMFRGELLKNIFVIFGNLQ